MNFGQGGMADLGFGSWQVPSLGTPNALMYPLAGIAALVLTGMYANKPQDQQWDKTTAKRVRATFTYFAVSILAWAGTAILCWKTGLVPNHPFHIFGIFAATCFAMYKVLTLDYDRDRMAKVSWFTAFAALQGVNMSTILLQLAMRGMLYLAVQAGAITAADLFVVAIVIVSFPNQNWLWLRGLLSTGMGLLLGANLVNLMLGNRTMHMGLAYVGAAMFTVALLYDAQRVIKQASIPPGVYRRVDAQGREMAQFDPIQHATEIYLDAINLFMYILRILLDQEERSENRSQGERRNADGPRPPLGLRPPGSNFGQGRPDGFGLRRGIY